MGHRKAFVTLILLTSAPWLCGGSHAAEPYAAVGIGTSSCLFWTKEREIKQSFSWDQWLLGFVSGAGSRGISPLTDPDGVQVLAWIENYCRANPLDQLATAGHAYVTVHSR
jgi:hypothetical protein